MIDDLAARRADKANDSRLWSAEDALEDTLRCLRAGIIKPEQLAIHWFSALPDGTTKHGYSVAGLTYPQHLALLLVAQKRAMEDWSV